jgi:hypothetical protein
VKVEFEGFGYESNWGGETKERLAITEGEVEAARLGLWKQCSMQQRQWLGLWPEEGEEGAGRVQLNGRMGRLLQTGQQQKKKN